MLERWRAGDEVAGSALLKLHLSTLSRFFRGKVDRAVLPDLIQKTMLGSVESRDRVPDGLEFRAYLLGIARRVLAQHYREHQRSARGHDALRDVEEVRPRQRSPSSVFGAHAEQRLLLRSLRKLDLELQMVLELYYWEELRTDEIGHVLDVPRGTVKSRLRRAREALRKSIESVGANPSLTESTVGDMDRWARSMRRLILDGEGT